MQRNSATYCDEPADAEEFAAWLQVGRFSEPFGWPKHVMCLMLALQHPLQAGLLRPCRSRPKSNRAELCVGLS